ncbi:MAG: hypothetical protein V3S69_05320 [Dehalococcoidales bacterium]
MLRGYDVPLRLSQLGKLSITEQRLEALREECHHSLKKFAKTVEPHRVYGRCHEDLYDFWQKQEVLEIDNTLALLPRDHQKSHMLAVRCAWEIYRNPAITILYVSATAGLAARQLTDIKQILTGKPFCLLSPTMVAPEEGKRAMWNATGISVDHPDRIKEGVRDPTVSIAGLDTTVTGWHCQFLAKDDVVVPDNAYTIEARKKVEAACSQLASVLTTDGVECAVGTRYHPKDHYNSLINMTEDIHDEETGEILDSKSTYSCFERQVETDGIFLWPRQRRLSDGKMFGFNWGQLARKKAKYTDKLQFHAQYYNNPNDLDNRSIGQGNFVYYNRERIIMKRGKWYYGDRRLNVYAAMDFAYSLNKKADWTCIVVFGVDHEFNIYVLEIRRFKTKKAAVYFDNVKDLVLKWEFSFMRAEVTAAQAVIVETLKDTMLAEGFHVKVEDHRPNKYDGAKKERCDAALLPKYEAQKVYHYKGGECTLLEEELLLDNPDHDDIKDTLAAGLSSKFIKKPRRINKEEEHDSMSSLQFHTHSRFGGCH